MPMVWDRGHPQHVECEENTMLHFQCVDSRLMGEKVLSPTNPFTLMFGLQKHHQRYSKTR